METGIWCILSILINFACTERAFVFVGKKLDWTSAQTYCREKYTDLVTVYNQKENQKLMSVAGNVDACIWIGLRHNFDNWRWSMGEPKIFYDEKDDIWADGQPDNYRGKQYCGAMYIHFATGVSDETCTDNYYFICFNGNASVKYILVQQKKTWREAQDFCREVYDDLASVTEKEVHSDLLLQLKTAGVLYAWIGLYKDPWTAWSDSTNTSFYNWETQSIYNTDDFCGCLNAATGKWDVFHCTTGYIFFCYGDGQRQTILKMKLQSGVDLNNLEIQQQILEQLKNRLGPGGEANVTVKWRATTKTSNPAEPATNQTVQIKYVPLPTDIEASFVVVQYNGQLWIVYSNHT